MSTVTVIRKKSALARSGLALQFDYWLLLAIAGLLLFGLMMVYSATFDLGLMAKEQSSYYFQRQLMAAGIGLLAGLLILQFDYHILRHFSVPMLLVTVGLLIFLLFFGEAIFGARRGLSEGSYQPSEVAKLITILYIAHWVSSKGERIRHVTYGLLPFSILVGVICGLIVLQPDLSTALLIAMVSFTLFFVAGADWRQITIFGAIGAVMLVFLVNWLPHASTRINSWREALRDPELASYQVKQAFIAIFNGGVWGVGLGQGQGKFGFLPAAHTDGIFAVVGEELGLMGSLLIISFFVLFVWRGLRTAWMARDNYGSMLALGITCWLGYQALINLAVITAVIPFTGIPLPFISYGGSSLAISLVGAAILLNVSRDTRLKKTEIPKQQQMPAPENNLETADMRRRHRRPHLSGAGRTG
jgi:cell division protein FtsW